MIQFKGDSSEQAITDSVLKQTKGTKWTLDSLVSDIVKEEYTKQGKSRFIEKSLEIMEENQIMTLRDWASLSAEDKKLLPSVLRDILDDISLPQGMLFT